MGAVNIVSNWPYRFVLWGSSVLLLFLAACGGSAETVETPTPLAPDITATAAAAIIMAALGTPVSGSEPMTDAAQAAPPVLALAATLTPAAPVPDATALAATIDAEVITQVHATLTASAPPAVTPTAVVAAAATLVPLPTVDGTAFAAQVATQVARELENTQATMAAAPQPATSTPTHAPTRRPTATWTPAPAPRVRTAPTSAQDTASIWAYTTFQDLSNPGTHTYYVDVAASERLRWAFEWCATSDPLLADILMPLVLEFTIDGVNVAAEDMTRAAKNYTGWRCRTWATEVSGWPQAETVTLEIHYRLLDAIFDGKNTYPAGDYYQVIYAAIR